jgi:hypothetical protein
MTLSRPVKVVIGVLTLVPFVHIAAFMATFLWMFTTISQMKPGPPPEGIEYWFGLVFVLHFAMMLFVWVLIAFYMVYLFKTDRVAADKKALWAVVLFMAGLVAMPVFFWFYIWPEHEAAAG